MPTLSQMTVPPPRDWSEFEDITRSALRVKWRSSDMQRNGRQGQAQAGVDVFGHDDLARWIGVQCRKKDNTGLKLNEVMRAATDAEKFDPPLVAFYMATTQPRDAGLQKQLRVFSEERKKQNKFPVGVFFWEDLYEDLVGDLREFAKHYPELVPLRSVVTSQEVVVNAPVPTGALDNPTLKNLFRASQEVYSIAHNLTAGMNTHPDTDWGEVCEMIALDFDGGERQLAEIIKDYGLFLDDSILDRLRRACSIAREGKHHVTFNDHDGPQVDSRGRDAADEFHKLLSEAAEIARRIFREQSGLA